jgi:hypothetical protein
MTRIEAFRRIVELAEELDFLQQEYLESVYIENRARMLNEIAEEAEDMLEKA